jgi:hypothetical protein
MLCLVKRFAFTLVFASAAVCVCAQAVEDEGSNTLRNAQLDWTRSDRPGLGRGAIRPLTQDPSMGGAPDANGNTAQLWAVSLQDKTLYRVMRRWAAQAQYQLVWQIDRDFPIESEVVFEGSFRSAVAEVMSGVSMTDYPLQAIFNSNTRMLRVVRFLEERDSARR